MLYFYKCIYGHFYYVLEYLNQLSNLLCASSSTICFWCFIVAFLLSQGANRTAEEAERDRRERDERMRHSRNPAARGIPAASGRPRPTQDGAPPTPLTPTSHTGKQSDTYLSGT